jgi:hypothetical protein
MHGVFLFNGMMDDKVANSQCRSLAYFWWSVRDLDQ